MSFKDALTVEIAASSKRMRCTVCALEDTLSAGDWTDLQASLADPTIPHTAIYRALKSIGASVGDTTVARHRKGECRPK